MKFIWSISLALALFGILPTSENAWYCRTNGVYGGSHWGRSNSLSEARSLAVYWCRRHGGGGCVRSLQCVP